LIEFFAVIHKIGCWVPNGIALKVKTIGDGGIRKMWKRRQIKIFIFIQLHRMINILG
jgi:hypothetical protein